jgi:hypothetical protein
MRSIVGLCGCLAAAAHAADFHVATNGSDAAAGGPFASLERARDAARALRAGQPERTTPIVIRIGGGTHRLPRTFVLEPADSGTAAAPLVFEAAPGETAILSGGIPIAGWKDAGNGRWTAAVDGATNGGWSFAQFYVNDQRRFRPTLPRDGYFFAAGGAHATRGTALEVRDADRDPAWTRDGGAEVLLFHNWSMSRLPLRSLDPASGHMELSGGTWHPERMTKITGATRYRVENVAAALGQPGDWRHDPAAGTIVYVPMPGERPEGVAAVAPRLPELVRLAGDRKAGRFVEHVVFRGLTLAHTSWTVPSNGYSFCQAEAVIPAALAATAARNIVVEDCIVRHTAGYAVDFGAGCQACRVERCEMVDLGAGGVKIGGLNAADIATGCVVRDCRIESGGRVHPAAIGVWIGFGAESTVERNEISDFYYSAVSVGWQWNTNATPCRNNRILDNHLHHLGQSVLCDMGGIYTLGRQPGTVLAGNHIHDVSRRCDGYGGWGLYFDEGSSEILEIGNLAYRTQDAPFHAHACRENTIRGNIFAWGTNAMMQFSNPQRLGPLTLENNVFVGDWAKLYAHDPDDEIVFRSNLYWRAGSTAAVTFPKGQALDAWRKREPGAAIADPGFVDAAAGDFRLKPGAAAAAFGIPGFDPASAGRITKGTKLSGLPPVPRAYPPAVPPPPYSLNEDFERRAVGHAWPEFEQQAASKETDAVVSEETAAGGRRSLCFRDGPGGAGYQPHLYRDISFTSGVVRAGIDVRIEPGATMEFEIREEVGRYHEGPHVLIRGDGTLHAAGKDLLKVPVNEWVRIDMSAGVGPQRTGTWRLEVRLPGAAAPQVFDALPLRDTFRTARWIGLASHGHDRVRFFVDNVAVNTTP